MEGRPLRRRGSASRNRGIRRQASRRAHRARRAADRRRRSEPDQGWVGPQPQRGAPPGDPPPTVRPAPRLAVRTAATAGLAARGRGARDSLGPSRPGPAPPCSRDDRAVCRARRARRRESPTPAAQYRAGELVRLDRRTEAGTPSLVALGSQSPYPAARLERPDRGVLVTPVREGRVRGRHHRASSSDPPGALDPGPTRTGCQRRRRTPRFARPCRHTTNRATDAGAGASDHLGGRLTPRREAACSSPRWRSWRSRSSFSLLGTVYTGLVLMPIAALLFAGAAGPAHRPPSTRGSLGRPVARARERRSSSPPPTSATSRSSSGTRASATRPTTTTYGRQFANAWMGHGVRPTPRQPDGDQLPQVVHGRRVLLLRHRHDRRLLHLRAARAHRLLSLVPRDGGRRAVHRQAHLPRPRPLRTEHRLLAVLHRQGVGDAARHRRDGARHRVPAAPAAGPWACSSALAVVGCSGSSGPTSSLSSRSPPASPTWSDGCDHGEPSPARSSAAPLGLLIIGLLVAFAVGQAAQFLGIKDLSVLLGRRPRSTSRARAQPGRVELQQPGGDYLSPVNLPRGVATVLLRPFPWETSSPFQLLASLESVLVAVLFVVRFSSIRTSLAPRAAPRSSSTAGC